MKSRVRTNDNCECFFEVEVPADVVDRTIKEVYDDIRKHAKIPGFRVGNAPQDLLEKYHGADMREEVLKRLIPECYNKVLTDKKIGPVSYPEFSDIDFAGGRGLTFKAKVDVRPEIRLKKYKGIKVKSKKAEVTDEEVRSALERFQGMSAKYTPVAEARPVQKGDFVICDIEAFVDDRPISKKHEGMWVEASKEASMLGVGESLIGANTGETRDVDVKLPETYPDKKYAGKDAKFKILAREIKQKELPALDDDFAKDLGEESMPALEEKIREELLGKKKANEEIGMKNQIIERLISDHKMAVPPTMLKRQSEVLMKRVGEDLSSRGMDKKAVEDKLKELGPQIGEDAANKVRLYFIIEAIAEKEGIKVGTDDIENKYESVARLAQQDVEAVKKYYKDHDLADGLVEQICEEKTLDWLLEQAEKQEA
ncbi:MAG: trigger factor [Candidatus Omnitrophota bacterium]